MTCLPLLEAGQFLLQSGLLARRCLRQTALCLGNTGRENARRVGVAGHRGVAEHGFGACRGDHHLGRLAWLRVHDRVPQIVEMTLHGLVNDLVVGNGRLQLAIPVDEPVAAENQAVAEHREERPAHRMRAHRVHGEALAVPIARAPHALLLLNDALLIQVLPFPDAFFQPGAAHVVARLAFQLQQAFLHHGLGGDAGVIGAGHPQGVVAHHAVPTDQQVLHHVVHGMAHVQGAGDVGQRHHDDVRIRVVIRKRRKRLVGQPAVEDSLFDLRGLVLLG